MKRLCRGVLCRSRWHRSPAVREAGAGAAGPPHTRNPAQACTPCALGTAGDLCPQGHLPSLAFAQVLPEGQGEWVAAHPAKNSEQSMRKGKKMNQDTERILQIMSARNAKELNWVVWGLF